MQGVNDKKHSIDADGFHHKSDSKKRKLDDSSSEPTSKGIKGRDVKTCLTFHLIKAAIQPLSGLINWTLRKNELPPREDGYKNMFIMSFSNLNDFLYTYKDVILQKKVEQINLKGIVIVNPFIFVKEMASIPEIQENAVWPKERIIKFIHSHFGDSMKVLLDE